MRMTVKFLRMHCHGKDQKLIFIVNIFADLAPNLESSFGTQNMILQPKIICHCGKLME